jgi:hypothetical protein
LPANTPNLVLPYPVPADTVDVPRDVKALADRLDVVVPVIPAIGYQRRIANNLRQISAPGAAVVFNAAGAPFVDLTPGQWHVWGSAFLRASAGDIAMLSLYNETTALSLASAESPIALVGPSPGGSTAVTEFVITVAVPTRLRLLAFGQTVGTTTLQIGEFIAATVAVMVAYLVHQ